MLSLLLLLATTDPVKVMGPVGFEPTISSAPGSSVVFYATSDILDQARLRSLSYHGYSNLLYTV